jgi:hypothetical protein
VVFWSGPRKCVSISMYTRTVMVVLIFSASSLLMQIKTAFSGVDVIITSGGVSMGEKVITVSCTLTWLTKICKSNDILLIKCICVAMLLSRADNNFESCT